MNNLYEKIIELSPPVDARCANLHDDELLKYQIEFPVPDYHPRGKTLSKSIFRIRAMADVIPVDATLIVDSGVQSSMDWDALPTKNIFKVVPAENTFKEIHWLNDFIEALPKETQTIVGIGGGIVLNGVAYICERRKSNFISVPTTVLAMADAAIGGLVRINSIEGEVHKKNEYKSVWEPDEIIIDERFLDSLPHEQISFGSSEIIKHGFYQSLPLLNYLASSDFQPFTNKLSLLKSIMWTAELKRVCLEADPEEHKDGAGIVLRGGHDLGEALEEESKFRVAHGAGVAVGMYQDALKYKPDLVPLLDTIYAKLQLPKQREEVM